MRVAKVLLSKEGATSTSLSPTIVNVLPLTGRATFSRIVGAWSEIVQEVITPAEGAAYDGPGVAICTIVASSQSWGASNASPIWIAAVAGAAKPSAKSAPTASPASN